MGPGSRGAAIAFALSFLVAGIGLAVLFWTYDRAYYATFARHARLDELSFSGPGQVALEDILSTDDRLRRLVLREPESPPGEPPATAARVPLNERELEHLRDVASIYDFLKPLTVLASILVLTSAALVDRRLRRRIALGEAFGIVAVGAVAAVAFEPLFLLFHAVLFPQGDFLFDPATDNLVLLYPESYWLSVTLRVGATFVMMAIAVAATASLPVRSPATATRRKEGSKA